MVFSSILCVLSYLLAVFSPWSILSLIGCVAGPTLVGMISNIPGGQMKTGLLMASIFPLILLLLLTLQSKHMMTRQAGN